MSLITIRQQQTPSTRFVGILFLLTGKHKPVFEETLPGPFGENYPSARYRKIVTAP